MKDVTLRVFADNGVPATMTVRVDYTMEDGEPLISGVWYDGNIYDYLYEPRDAAWLLGKIIEAIKKEEEA